ncbi:hypothetical protein CDAR_187411 [Caerostris darwini]|uniref:Uncharacterized protein n=1 Tax=Caerostris darwini TaxID=1538125 RepID=A0AAV4SLD3_9ARAC|nr:hypothetical protein CDAR_187411 [Caerostris darwini]
MSLVLAPVFPQDFLLPVKKGDFTGAWGIIRKAQYIIVKPGSETFRMSNVSDGKVFFSPSPFINVHGLWASGYARSAMHVQEIFFRHKIKDI